ncbi:MAG: PD-(D/E)XK nuclease family protein [Elusimicrobiota bacterium]|jgi:hypothetical protein|nr:PD-(D/E)XK nuclease family protein [Elusimicrobiota bacterium]
MTQSQSAETLLNSISAINKRHYELAELSGENFNVFEMFVGHYELKHSKFIAELLNPTGSHGQGDIFLKLFVKEANINNFATETAEVETEHSFNDNVGGRIDIVIKNNRGEQIFIENKIYADDGNTQLLRYHEYKPNARILYLTLDGAEPSEKSVGNIDETKKQWLTMISYSETIIKWLENCKKEAVNMPLLRETISQYIFHIQDLTNQTRSKKMSKEIAEVIAKNAENFEAALKIQMTGVLEEAKRQIAKNTFENAFSALAAELNLHSNVIKGYEKDSSNTEKPYDWWGVEFKDEKWKSFTIRFAGNGWSNCGFYFQSKDEGDKKWIDYLDQERQKNKDKYKSDENSWLFYQKDFPYNWDKNFFLEMLKEPQKEKIKSEFKRVIEEFKEYRNKFEKNAD